MMTPQRDSQEINVSVKMVYQVPRVKREMKVLQDHKVILGYLGQQVMMDVVDSEENQVNTRC